ncbi:AlbA family DNA-binding domain-containing protein [Pseudodesulfovibrio sediminis]|uniref:Schlafen AlbA-2 domain-containing protein n=1 Tax=Pseudodesulfovibrio sediminis TaxID=2810563 RepID=A0ABN6ER98_9BACT|nr:ATP-binding protein [Pseudodesulfovibrio sediminis]BCS87681.1 hypothetical protein PSDVSF_09230 [Pseudodesulfovibrio sediminis]
MSGIKAIRGTKLYSILFYGVIFTVAAIVALGYWGVREIRTDAAVVAVENSARGISGAVTVLLNAVTNSNSEIGNGVIPSLEPADLHKEFQSILDKHPMVSAVMVSDEHGLRYMFTRRAGSVAEMIPKRGDSPTNSWTLYRKDGTRDDKYKGWEYDWDKVDHFLADEFVHLKPEQINWRSSNKFYDSSETWITASSLVESEAGDRLMLSVLFPIDALLSQLAGAERGGAERIFLYWNNGQALPVTGSDTGRVKRDQVSQALEPEKLEDPVIQGAVSQLAAGGAERPFSYTAEGEVWWAYALPLTVFGDTMSLGVAVPRRNIVSSLTSDTFLQFFSTGLILLGAIALFFLHKNRTRIEAIGRRRHMVSTGVELLALVQGGENDQLEFKQTLRFNLKSGKNGREIEHASLKTVAAFLNSDGGTLLIGVADNGEITGFAEDQLDSTDHALLHFNNLVNQSIGAEFSRYINSAIIEVGGIPVLRVHCIPAPVPAILKDGKKEEFYVRSGPASRQLSLSQFYEWLKEH